MEQQTTNDGSDGQEQESSKKAGKKSKKTKAKKAEESESETEEAPAKKAPAKVKPKKKAAADDSDDGDQLPAQPISAFALLQGDDSDDAGNVVKSDHDDEPVKKPAKSKKKSKKKEQDDDDEPTTATGGKKEKKKKKKRGDSDEEDLDKMLAELQLEYDGVKKPDAPKAEAPKKKEKEQPAVVETPAPETEEKSKPKKDKKKKKAGGDEPAQPEVTPAATEAAAPVTATDEKPPAEGEGSAAAAKKKKGPGKAMVAAMQEALKKKKEDEERMQKEEEERIRLLEEADELRREQARLEQEKKDKKKLKEKERKERLKAEGKLLTAKQKADKARAEAMIESLKAAGAAVPGAGEKKVRPGTRIRPSKQKKEESVEAKPEEVAPVTPEEKPAEVLPVAVEEQKPEREPTPEPVEEIKDAWDLSSEEEEEEDDDDSKEEPVEATKKVPQAAKPTAAPAKKQQSVEEESESESEDSDESDDSEDDSSSEDSDHRTDAEKMRERAELRIQKREAEAETKRTTDNLRAAVVCVLGHVDTGKTKILDKLRRTNVQDGEAGGITQQIGATNVPIENIKDNTKHVKGFAEMIFKIPGLLIIDTPGHESFSNLRSRGSSLCDIAILVVDIMHGLEPQTIESLNMLKAKKTPFVVALNKIDRLYDWNTMPRKDVRDIIKLQAVNTQQEFDKRSKEVIVQFAEQGMNAALFYENPDPKTFISMVPTSAITGEGMGNLLMLVVQYSQKQLAKRLMYSETLQATVLEVKAIPGLGTTIDTILINGKLREGDTMILAGTDGPIVTQIKALLMPQPMKELRVKNAYVEFKEIPAAQGVKIAAKELEKAIAGINLQIAQKPDEIEIYKDIVAKDLRSVLRSIKLSDQGVFVQASTLGSLEALLEFLKTSKIPVSASLLFFNDFLLFKAFEIVSDAIKRSTVYLSFSVFYRR